jgi:hypothetical protein
MMTFASQARHFEEGAAAVDLVECRQRRRMLIFCVMQGG